VRLKRLCPYRSGAARVSRTPPARGTCDYEQRFLAYWGAVHNHIKYFRQFYYKKSDRALISNIYRKYIIFYDYGMNQSVIGVKIFICAANPGFLRRDFP